MTPPKERALALRLVDELLKKVIHSTKCLESIRLWVETVLRHYPDAWDIGSWARRYEPKSVPVCWLGSQGQSVYRLMTIRYCGTAATRRAAAGSLCLQQQLFDHHRAKQLGAGALTGQFFQLLNDPHQPKESI